MWYPICTYCRPVFICRPRCLLAKEIWFNPPPRGLKQSIFRDPKPDEITCNYGCNKELWVLLTWNNGYIMEISWRIIIQLEYHENIMILSLDRVDIFNLESLLSLGARFHVANLTWGLGGTILYALAMNLGPGIKSRFFVVGKLTEFWLTEFQWPMAPATEIWLPSHHSKADLLLLGLGLACHGKLGSCEKPKAVELPFGDDTMLVESCTTKRIVETLQIMGSSSIIHLSTGVGYLSSTIVAEFENGLWQDFHSWMSRR